MNQLQLLKGSIENGIMYVIVALGESSSAHDIMPNELPSELPLSWDNAINFVSGSSLQICLIIKWTLLSMLSWGDKLMVYYWSPYVIPALLMPKKAGSWRICMDSRVIKEITIKNRFPISRLNDLLDMMAGSHIFSKIYFRSGYQIISEKAMSGWVPLKFRGATNLLGLSLYEELFMSLGLSNTTSTFMQAMTFHAP